MHKRKIDLKSIALSEVGEVFSTANEIVENRNNVQFSVDLQSPDQSPSENASKRLKFRANSGDVWTQRRITAHLLDWKNTISKSVIFDIYFKKTLHFNPF